MSSSARYKIIGLLKIVRGKPNLKMMKVRGLRVRRNFNMFGRCSIDHSYCMLITIGDDVTFVRRAHVLSYDASTKHALGDTKMALASIGSGVFVGANSTILPGATVGYGAIIGAGSVVTKDVAPGTVVAGNPAHVLCTTAEHLEKERTQMEVLPLSARSLLCGGSLLPSSCVRWCGSFERRVAMVSSFSRYFMYTHQLLGLRESL